MFILYHKKEKVIFVDDGEWFFNEIYTQLKCGLGVDK